MPRLQISTDLPFRAVTVDISVSIKYWVQRGRRCAEIAGKGLILWEDSGRGTAENKRCCRKITCIRYDLSSLPERESTMLEQMNSFWRACSPAVSPCSLRIGPRISPLCCSVGYVAQQHCFLASLNSLILSRVPISRTQGTGRRKEVVGETEGSLFPPVPISSLN